MPLFALLLVALSSSMVGVMSIIRKEYQLTNGTSMSVTLFFTLFTSVIGFIIGWIANGGVDFNATNNIQSM